MLVLDNISFKVNDRKILQNVSLELRVGEIHGILGSSGSGKTTLFRIVSGLIQPYAGSIYYDGTNLVDSGVAERPISYLQQSFPLYNNLSVFDNVMIAFESLKKNERENHIKNTEEMLNNLGIYRDLWKRKPKNLSGGETQRVALVKALLKPCEILLLDEPFSNIDKNTKRKLNQLIRSICKKRNLITIYISHAEEDLLLIADKMAFMEEGKILQVGTAEELLIRPKYGKIASIGSILGIQLLEKSDFIGTSVYKNVVDAMPLRCEKIGWFPEKSEIYQADDLLRNKGEEMRLVLKGELDRISKIGSKIYVGVKIYGLSECQYVWHTAWDTQKVDGFRIGDEICIVVDNKDIKYLTKEDGVINDDR